MIYLEDEDLKTDAQERFINDSTADDAEATNKIEKRVIGLVTSYLSGRYDTDKIFDEDSPIRNEVLVDIMAKIVLYKVFKRNSGRKMTTTAKEENDWAMAQLVKINAGSIQLKDLPKPYVEPGAPDSDTLIGNLSNPDFYI